MNRSRLRWLANASIGVSALAGLGAFGISAIAASDIDCLAMLERPGVYVSGILQEPYRRALAASGRSVGADGRVDRITIVNGCVSGAFDGLIEGRADAARLPEANKGNVLVK